MQQRSPQRCWISQHSPSRQSCSAPQHRLPQTSASWQQVSPTHVAPLGQHASGQARGAGQHTSPLTQRSLPVQQCPLQERPAGQQAPSRHCSVAAQHAPPQSGVGQVQRPKMQTRLPEHRPQLLLMPQPSEPQARPSQFGTHPVGGFVGGFFGFFFFFFLRLAVMSTLAGDPRPRLNAAARRTTTPRRERTSLNDLASRSNCLSSTMRHPVRRSRWPVVHPGG